MKFEHSAKVVFGSSGCSIVELAEAITMLTDELGSDARIRIHTVPDHQLADNGPGGYAVANVAAIHGFVQQESP